MLSIVRRWLARQFSLVVLAGVLLFAIPRIYSCDLATLRWDAIGYHLWTRAILRGDLNFEPYRERYDYVGLYPTRDGAWWHNKYAPGVGLIRLPVMAFLIDADAPAAGISRREGEAALVLAAVALWWTAFFALRACRRIGVTGWAAHLAVIAGFFGTGLFFYCTSESGYSHVWSALGLALLLDWQLAACARPERKLAGPIVVITMMLMLIRNTNLLPIAALALSFTYWRYRRGMTWKRRLLWPMLGSAIGLAIHVALNSYAHGRLVFSSYAEEGFLWDRPMHLSVLFSFQQGLFLYAPLFAVVPIAGFAIHKTRPAAVASTLLTASLVVLYGYWHCWNLGGGPGHRGFVEIAPLLIPVLAGCLAWAPRSVRPLLVIAALASIWVSQSFGVGCFRGTFPWQEQTSDIYLNSLVRGRALWWH